MNNLIVFPLLLLICIGAFYQIIIFSTVDFTLEGNETVQMLGNQTLDDVESELEIQERQMMFDFNMTVGLVIIMVGAIALGLIGLNVLGSGLSPFSVKIIWNGIVYYGLWGLFSAFGYGVFVGIPYFGVFLWFILTALYTLGVFGRMGSDTT